MRARLAVALVAVLVGLGGCGDGGGTASDTVYKVVTNRIKVPTTTAEVQLWALDVDGDTKNGTDNALGAMIAAMSGAEVTFSSYVNKLITDGTMVVLHSFATNDLTSDTSVTWRTFVGSRAASPDFSGAGVFVVSPDSLQDSSLSGEIRNKRFRGGPGTVPLRMVLTEGSKNLITLHLVGARIEVDVSATGCSNGLIAGAITDTEVQNVLLPAGAEALNAVILEHCPTGPASCTPGSNGDLVLKLFDTTKDGKVTGKEIAENPLISDLMKPDVDLLDQSGAFNPIGDGVKDSLSLGMGFECVRASFDIPN